MYGLSEAEDLSFLVGRELQQVRIGVNEAALHFDSGVSITLATELTYRSAGGAVVRYESMPAAAPTLVSLLSTVVRGARSKPPGTLCLEFSSGDHLEIEDTSEHYESYQIRDGERLIVV